MIEWKIDFLLESWMDRKQNMYVLLGIIWLLGISWGSFYISKKQVYVQSNLDISDSVVEDNNLQQLSIAQIEEYVSSLLYSGNIELIARVFCQLPVATTIQLIENVVIQESTLNDAEKIELLFAVSACYKSKKDKYALFNLFLVYPEIYAKIPILFVCAHSLYAKKILSIFILWAQMQSTISKNKFEESFIDMLLSNAILYALNQNDIEMFKVFAQQQVPISPQLATETMAEVIKKHKNSELISLLAVVFNGDINGSLEGKRTMLMYAVESGNKKAVEKLLNLGVDVHKILAPQIGSALDIAIENNEVNIELLLRSYGARE